MLVDCLGFDFQFDLHSYQSRDQLRRQKFERPGLLIDREKTKVKLKSRIKDSIIWLKLFPRQIVCSDWLRRVTDFVGHFVYKGTTKGNFEKQQKFNKSSTKSCTNRTI